MAISFNYLVACITRVRDALAEYESAGLEYDSAHNDAWIKAELAELRSQIDSVDSVIQEPELEDD